jgi:hypothetical protein
MARPRLLFSPEDRELALALTAAGKPVQEIALQLMLEVPQFQQRRAYDKENPELAKRWEAAALEGIEALADSLVDVDTRKGPYQARIYSENVKWLLARRAAAKYGDRLDITQGVTTVDIAQALSDARSRAMVKQADVREITAEIVQEAESADSASVDEGLRALIDWK